MKVELTWILLRQFLLPPQLLETLPIDLMVLEQQSEFHSSSLTDCLPLHQETTSVLKKGFLH